MLLVVSNEGEKFLLDRVTGRVPYDPLNEDLVRLYQNDFTPTRDVVLADLEEADFAGYTGVPLTAADWTAPDTVAGAAASWYGTGPLTWLASSGTQWVYGAYATDSTGTVLLWVVRFDSPQMVNSTTPASYQPTLTGRSEQEPV